MVHARTCILNVGYYRTGSATLAKAAELVGYKVRRCSYGELDEASLKALLLDPVGAVTDWWTKGGEEMMEQLIAQNDLVYGGHVPWLIMLHDNAFDTFCRKIEESGVLIRLIATRRHLSTFMVSELHQWVLNDLERKAGLDEKDRSHLDELLTARALLHAAALDIKNVDSLLLEDIDKWPAQIEMLGLGKSVSDESLVSWEGALLQAGKMEASPNLPLEGILIALRIESKLPTVARQVDELLLDLKQDRLCNMIVVLGLNGDEVGTCAADQLVEHVRRIVPVHPVEVPRTGATMGGLKCQQWDRMAAVAFENGAHWVLPLSTVTKIECSYHYRAFYRAFLDISEELQCPLGFGCAWWSHEFDKGLSAAPVIGRSHYDLFKGLLALDRSASCSHNGFLLYLENLYNKFKACPQLEEARLKRTDVQSINVEEDQENKSLIDDISWRDWLAEDLLVVREYLSTHSSADRISLDVVVPTYRLDMAYLERICCLKVPTGLWTVFIIVVDNPSKLKSTFEADDVAGAAKAMEKHLKDRSGNNVWVKCNSVNSGAPATRNHGLDESAADFILLLDDDVIPDVGLLVEYEKAVRSCDESIVGLVGMVQFPRRSDLPAIHAAVLTCPLTGMFEIASNSLFEYPAWGITANLLVRRAHTRFDLAYTAGEDVDYCLSLAKETGGKFLSVPTAKVTHDYWPGGFLAITHHFFRWALGDGVLFSRHPYNCYMSWPNVVEYGVVIFLFWVLFLMKGIIGPFSFLALALCLFLVDLAVDLGDPSERDQRKALIQHDFPWWYYIAVQSISNTYVIGFEIGRLIGNWGRGDLLRNACKRYEWQCGRQPNLRAKVVHREGIKFAGFLVVTVANMYFFGKRM